MEGRIDVNGIDSYVISNLTVDNTLFVYMNGTSGDLDPFMGLCHLRAYGKTRSNTFWTRTDISC